MPNELKGFALDLRGVATKPIDAQPTPDAIALAER
jgi:hypothetical protein